MEPGTRLRRQGCSMSDEMQIDARVQPIENINSVKLRANFVKLRVRLIVFLVIAPQPAAAPSAVTQRAGQDLSDGCRQKSTDNAIRAKNFIAFYDALMAQQPKYWRVWRLL